MPGTSGDGLVVTVVAQVRVEQMMMPIPDRADLLDSFMIEKTAGVCCLIRNGIWFLSEA